MRDQRIRDPVHDLIKFSGSSRDDAVLWRLIQSAPLQRLRRIRQLGFTDYVYPGATHSRFAHALGAMQMARRMLEVFERNRVLGPGGRRDHALWKRATLCATLLHDIGHGPYSHVFERLSAALGIDRHHESFTRQIIEAEPIRGLLAAESHELFEATVSFFTREPGSNPYSRIVSSQLDADRLDFLLRDRLATGVKFGRIDLEWLFDSLRLEQLSGGEEGGPAYCFVLSAKGLAVAHGYLAAYAQMYSHVYFHKTVRAVELMVQDALQALLAADPEAAGEDLATYAAQAPRPSLAAYLALDDGSVMAALKSAARDGRSRAGKLARRVLERDLYKAFLPPHPPGQPLGRARLDGFRRRLEAAGIAAREDVIPSKGYKPYDIMGDDFLSNILVESPGSGEPRAITDLLPEVQHLAEPASVRFYFPDARARDKAARIWAKLG